MNINKNKIKLVLCFLITSVSGAYSISLSAAEIYKCVNNENKVYYNDKPCPLSDTEKKMRSVKDPEGGYVPTLAENDSAIKLKSSVTTAGVSSNEFTTDEARESDSAKLGDDSLKSSGGLYAGSNSGQSEQKQGFENTKPNNGNGRFKEINYGVNDNLPGE